MTTQSLPAPDEGRARVRANLWIGLSIALCCAAIAFGMATLWSYAARPGDRGPTPPEWPVASRLPRAAGVPTLVVVLHAYCPCSRASVVELGEIVGRVRGRLAVHALVVVPRSASDLDARESAIGRGVAELPGVSLHVDRGREAALFGASTSGHAAMYDAGGSLIFAGGITGARGHAGANEGRASILALLSHAPASAETPVYGCPTGGRP